MEPVEPEGGEVPEVPEVPLAMGSVRCGGCACFDADDLTCVEFDRPTTAGAGENCSK
jgi:hypothetical protein